MKKRPVLLWVVGLVLAVSPLYYYLNSVGRSLWLHRQVYTPLEFLEHLPTLKLIALVIGPFVGALVLSVRPIGWWAILGFTAYSIIANIVLMAQRGTDDITLWVAAMLSLAAGTFFIRKEIKSPYFNPSLRWWERVRVQVSLKVDIQGRESLECSTFDLSETGVFLVTDAPFTAGSRTEMKLHLPNGPVATNGMVMWVSDGSRDRPKGVGIKFDAPSPVSHQEFKALKKKLESSSAAAPTGDSPTPQKA